jgi:hypothetical protein
MAATNVDCPPRWNFHDSFWVANPHGGAVDVGMWNECVRARDEQEDLG